MGRRNKPKIDSDIDDGFLFKEKRKWQIALRRYVLDQHKSTAYAPYFGLDNNKFREWIEGQFTNGQSWDNFSEKWQFDHILPVAYFDFTKEEDLRICWNFINIRVAKTGKEEQREARLDVLGAKVYFCTLYKETNLAICESILVKIQTIEASQLEATRFPTDFINQNKDYIIAMQGLTVEEYERLNTGTTLSALLYEKEFLKKFSA
ncbi:hypothetical protein HRH25_03070 [Flavisolibacter sp. BT320]|nr:hypothetical protein [Flavisolibacter longurius]